MTLGNILVIVGCLVAGYVVVSLLMNISSDDMRPPPGRDDPPPRAPAREASPAPQDRPRLPARSPVDWTLLLDIPRTSSRRDIEAAFRRQLASAEAAGDRDLVERLRQARHTALAESRSA